MKHEIKAGSILMRADAPLPKELHFERERCLPGWMLVTDLDGHGVDLEIEKAGWTLLCLAGARKTSVFGIDAQKMVCRAIEGIVARDAQDHFNSLEITQVTSAGSERFPLIRYMTVTAQWRHIQRGLIPANDTSNAKVDAISASKAPARESTGILFLNDAARGAREGGQL